MEIIAGTPLYPSENILLFSQTLSTSSAPQSYTDAGTPVNVSGVLGKKFHIELNFPHWRLLLFVSFGAKVGPYGLWGLDNFKMTFGKVDIFQGGVFLSENVFGELVL